MPKNQFVIQITKPVAKIRLICNNMWTISPNYYEIAGLTDQVVFSTIKG
jgi:hypothetical protein